MKKAKKKVKNDVAKMDMSSMIDVVFLLLIFFIVTAKEVIEEAHVSINFPEQKDTLGAGQSDSIIIGVLSEKNPPSSVNGRLVYDPNARIYRFEEVVINLKQLESRIRPIAELDAEEIKIDIKTHKDAKNYRLIQVLDLCGKLGLKKLNLTTLK